MGINVYCAQKKRHMAPELLRPHLLVPEAEKSKRHGVLCRNQVKVSRVDNLESHFRCSRTKGRISATVLSNVKLHDIWLSRRKSMLPRQENSHFTEFTQITGSNAMAVVPAAACPAYEREGAVTKEFRLVLTRSTSKFSIHSRFTIKSTAIAMISLLFSFRMILISKFDVI